MELKNIRQVAENKIDHGEGLSFHESVQFLTAVLPSANKVLFRSGEGIERSKKFFELLDNPQDAFPSVHIAGTSGKGTVAYLIESLLSNGAGKITGLHTSPHVYDIRERSIISGSLPPETEFAGTVTRLIRPILEMESSESGRPTYFEATNAIAFSMFRDNNIDYGVIETGLGGLYDSTNTITRQDKLAIITKLGLDHTEILGETIDKIAHQKAGIMPRHGEAVAWKPKEPEALEALQSVADERHTQLHFIDESYFTITNQKPGQLTITYHDESRTIDNITLLPGASYQAENTAVAIYSTLLLASRDNFHMSDESIRGSISNVRIPGRNEKTRLFNTDVVIDGAHNPQKISAFLETLNPIEPKPIFVIALKKTKEAKEIFELIQPYAEAIVITQFFTQQDGVLANYSYNAVDLGEIAARVISGNAIKVHEDNLQAVTDACMMAKPDQKVVITGSFYLLGEIRDRLYSQGLI